jgi:hypothetical protein
MAGKTLPNSWEMPMGVESFVKRWLLAPMHFRSRQVSSMVAESWVQVGTSSLNDSPQALEQALQNLQSPQDRKLIVALIAPNFDLAVVA